MPHRPLFVLRCHHFSPVIYFIAISVSLPPSPSPSPPSLQCLSSFFTCALPPSPAPAPPLVSSFSCTLSIHPAARRAYEHLVRNSPLHNATQFRSPHPPGDFIIRFYLRLVLTPSLSQSSSSSAASLFSFAHVASYRRHFDDDTECEREGERRMRREGGTRDRARSRERERKRYREYQATRRERESGGQETALSTARCVRRRERYNCI